ncbi:MAG TPA: glycosyltransferase family 39 protein, partial [Candidatus Krumholzibacterium sp.]|nr:glycosyltransferase family 39 protein [Candidatus Krumholzibacterium sp.]
MITKLFQTRRMIWLILLYGLLLTAFHLDYMAVFVDEAYHVVMGRQLLRGEACPGCPFSSGWVYIHPITAAAADAVGGIYAVRGMNIILGLLLVLCVFITAKRLFNEKIGVIAAAILMFSGQTPYLMRLGTYDMMAAFLLGCSFMIIAISTTEEMAGRRRALTLIGGMLLLFFAAVSKYLLPSFVPAIGLWALYKHRFSRAMMFSIFMLAGMAALFWFFAP